MSDAQTNTKLRLGLLSPKDMPEDGGVTGEELGELLGSEQARAKPAPGENPTGTNLQNKRGGDVA